MAQPGHLHNDITAAQPTGTNLLAWPDNGSTRGIYTTYITTTQPTGTNLLAWPDNGSTKGIYTTYVTTTQPTGTNLLAHRHHLNQATSPKRTAQVSTDIQLHYIDRQVTGTHSPTPITHPVTTQPAQYDAHSHMSSTKHVQLAHSIITHMSSLIHRHMRIHTFINVSSSTIHACTNACIVVSLCCDHYRRHPPDLNLPLSHAESNVLS